MKTDVIMISGDGRRTEKALQQAEKVIAYKELKGKNALHLRLLTEEMMGMMRSITGETEGKFWIEDQDGEFQIHLRVVTRMDSGKRDRLLSVSSSGRNESARGLMGKIRDFFDRSADDDLAAYSGALMLPEMYDYSTAVTPELEWSMMEYENALSGRLKNHEAGAEEAWDELEKSVVAHVADDVKVYIREGVVEMVIFKKMA